MTTRRPTVVVAVHDGLYGCGTGAGYANRAFLAAVVGALSPAVRLVVLPVRLSAASSERHPAWHRDLLGLLGAANIHPVDNGTSGLDRWGGLPNFRRLCDHAARVLREHVLPVAGPLLIVAFDVPFLGLSALLPAEAVPHLVLVPRSSGLSHTPWDRDRIEWERDGLRRHVAHGGRVGAISGHMARHLRRDYGVPPRALIDLRDGLAPDDWALPRDAPIPLPPFVFAMGRAEPYKGFDDLLDALAILRSDGHRLPHLVLAATTEAATTEYQRRLAARVDRLGLDATLRTRFGPEVRGLLTHPALRAVVVPSRAEPFGRIPVEAFAAGAGPVVATTAGGLREQVVDGVTGFTSPPGDPRRLAAAIRRALLADDASLAALRTAGRALAERRFDYGRSVLGFLAALAPWATDESAAMIGYGQHNGTAAHLGPSARGVGSVSSAPWVKAPVGRQTPHWNTIRAERQILVVVHNVTAATRLLDVIGAFDSDPRVQVVFSWNGSDPFHHGLDELLNRLGVIVIPWEQAIQTEFHLAITANHGGLTELTAPIVVLSHGIGYTKNSPGNRKPETGNRKPETGNRKPETGNRQVFGLSPQWLLYDGQPIAAALVLSHEEQRERLAKAVPEALSTAVVAGDPCYDRIAASLRHRARYRRALGAEDGRRVVAVTSTWGPRSLLGSWPELFGRLLAELPVDSYRVVGIVHPNAWHGHGPWQVRTWLADAVRSGLVLVPPLEGWRAALIAADGVIGDHGSVTTYAAAIDRPTLLGAFPEDDIADGSPVDLLGQLAPRLHRDRPLRAQLDRAIDDHAPGRFAAVGDLVTSVPHESLERLRRLFYSLLDLPEPPVEPPVFRLPRKGLSAPRTPSATLVVCAVTDRTATITRYPAEVRADGFSGGGREAAHLVVHADHPGRRMLGTADIVVGEHTEDDPDPEDWLRATMVEHPGIALAALIDGRGACLVRTCDGDRLDLVPDGADADPTLCASVVHSWLADGRDPAALGPTVTIRAGHRVFDARVVPR
ncbi:glycosyltransferase family 4 protein [Solihabitans fulvus]|uniref:Glycosyltransferase family 4 protein n=1 Tax=Solihabitans fulvus TaxID=1892852 RepID=A0A5B2X4P6_9PSEU|nr:glycosyltransferase family 4 protein [Solihabitans fulvus]KAA2258109.1 glycosyltransferase family 4 protein [Solihabitans fulvus]